jgi:UDP-2,3-diacylglucosamine pyrophosphatase LpxH
MICRQVFVISDLHLGGVYGDPGNDEDRGFRLNTHVSAVTRFVTELAERPRGKGYQPAIELIINGDAVDFLAEGDGDPPTWMPFCADPAVAIRKLEAIAARDSAFFAALAAFLARGHRLVVLLGNHDVELALPDVRRVFERLLGAGGRDYHFVYDGEAYTIGDALIEHGHRYDKWNVVDQSALRRVRSLQSRRLPVAPKYQFDPPAGSRLVCSTMNPLKQDYLFVDLLKPETELVLPILLALEPGFRALLADVLPLRVAARGHRLASAAMPMSEGDISMALDGAASAGDLPFAFLADADDKAPNHLDALSSTVRSVLGDEADNFFAALDFESSSVGVARVPGEDIASAWPRVNRALGLTRLLVSKNTDAVERRLPALLRAIRVIQNDRTFDPSVETLGEYEDAARELSSGGFRWVLFGHTHLARSVDLGNGARYLNSGTWADLMRFPAEILAGSEADGIASLHAFVSDLRNGHLRSWVTSRPTFVRLDVDESGRAASAELCDFH